MSMSVLSYLWAGAGSADGGALRRRHRRRLGRSPELLGRGDAAAQRHRNADVAESKLGAGERAQQHDLVQAAQMADAKGPPRQLGKPDAERQLVALIGPAHDRVGVV